MAGFGKKLREARLRQGYTIEQVEEETKIRKLYLNALEEENFSILPPQVYAQGFVKRYARFLNMDIEELSREFKELAYANKEAEDLEQIPLQPPKESILNKMPVRNIMIAAMFLIIAIWAGNYLVGYISREISQDNTPKPSVVDKNTNKPPVEEPAPPAPQVNATLKMLVKVKPQQKCWMQVRVDGEEKFAGVLVNGQQQAYESKDSIYIKAGNAAAVDIFINDKIMVPLGAPGEVVEKEFKYGVKY